MSKKKNNPWGGKWTELKLELFVKYVKAYLTIMNIQKKKYDWKIIYFDGFAGKGKIDKKKLETPEDQLDFFDYYDLSEEDLEDLEPSFEGSVHKILALDSPLLFDEYRFIDLKGENIDELKKLKSSLPSSKSELVMCSQGDCNKEIVTLANDLRKNRSYKALIFLDPYGMQIEWESIQSLKETGTDICILLPSGVAVNRLLPKSGEIKHKQKLESFFGLPIEEIKDFFYSKVPQQRSLFANEEQDTEQMRKDSGSIQKIVDLYRKQLNTVWDEVSKSPYPLKNKKNNPIYHLIFASNNPTAVKIMNDIFRKGPS